MQEGQGPSQGPHPCVFRLQQGSQLQHHWGWELSVAGCPVHGGMFSSSPVLCPLDTVAPPQLVTTKVSPAGGGGGARIKIFLAENHRSTQTAAGNG